METFLRIIKVLLVLRMKRGAIAEGGQRGICSDFRGSLLCGEWPGMGLCQDGRSGETSEEAPAVKRAER